MIEENEIKANEVNDWTGRTVKGSSRAKLGFTVAGLGIGGMLAYLISRNAKEARRRSKESQSREGQSTSREDVRNVVDDRGTTQEEAALILSNLRDRGFEGSDEKLALALGRTPEEMRAFNSRQVTIDDDVIMKARGIAMHRGVRLD
jgi:hypothetical protein